MILNGSLNDGRPGFIFRGQVILDMAIQEKKLHAELRMGNQGIVKAVEPGQLLKTAKIVEQADKAGDIGFLIRKF